MNCRLVSILTMLSLILTASHREIHAQRLESPRVVTIGFLIDGSWERTGEIEALFKKEIDDLLSDEFDVRFPPEKTVVADWTREGVESCLDQMLDDPDIDILVTSGTISSHLACQRRNLPRPVVAPFVIDVDLQGIPMVNGTSGVKNLHYLTFPAGIQRDLEMFFEIVPFEHLVILANKQFAEAVPELYVRGYTERMSRGLNVEITRILVSRSVEEALERIPPETDAVYVAPLTHLPPGEFDKLVDGLIRLKLPSFSMLGVYEVERGILAGLKPDMFPRIARRIALDIQRILLGEAPGSIPVNFSIEERLTINMATARAIGISPGWAVLTEAELINVARTDVSRRLDLSLAVREAVSVNLDLAARDRAVEAGEQGVNEARALLLPRIDIGALGIVIDDDRAAASFGQQAERTLSGSLTASQIIYSEPVWANYSIEKDLQRSREKEREQLRLDIVLDAGVTYLNVLRAKTFERIQRENLKRTRTNLETARIRDMVGSAGPAEVYRWESQIASNRKDVIESIAARNVVEIALNRILNRPLEEPFLTTETDLGDSALITAGGKWYRYIGDPQSFKTFRAAMVREGFSASPELAALDAAVDAQRRALSSATSRFWAPTLALQGELSNRFWESGAGSEPFAGAADLPFDFPEVDDTDWNVGLSATFPLVSGGSKLASRRRALEELDRLEIERGALAERIEQRVRSALHRMGSSYAGIEQSRDAAAAARKSFEVVSEAYAQGTISIIDLIDAQNTVLVADEVAANAVYDFLIDLMNVERSIGQFSFFMSSDEREAFFERIDSYYRQAGVPLRD